MADRYWVGGNAIWDSTAGTKWATTAGGAGGASVPTSADNVFFTVASNAITLTGAIACANLTVTNTATGNKFLTGTSGALSIYGSLDIQVAFTWSSTASVAFLSTTASTVNASNATIAGSVTFGSSTTGATGSWTLTSALTTTAGCNFHSGTLDTAGFSFTASSFSSNVSTRSRTLTLGASTLTFTSTAPFNLGTPTNANLTLNAGTSTIVCSSGGTLTFAGAGKTFYNVSFTSTAISARTIDGANTFNNLTLAARAAAGWNYYILAADQVVNGTLTLSASGTSYFRTQLRASSLNVLFTTARTITVASFAAGSADWDFCGIAITGAAAPISGTRFGDAGGSINSGITFDAPKTVYKNATGTNAITANAWSNTSGGAGNNIYFPLPQDTAIFDNNSNATFATSTNQVAGTLDFSARTTALTFNVTASIELYKDLILDSNVTVSTTTTRFYFFGANNQSFDGGGTSITCGVTVGKSSGTLTLASAITQAATATQSFIVQSGTVDFGSYAHTFYQLSCTDSTYSPTLTFGGGSVTVSSTVTSPFIVSNANATISGTGSVYATNTGTATKNITATPVGGRYIDFYITGGSGNASFSGTVGKIDFYNGGASTYTGNFANTAVSVYGNLILKSGMGWAVQANTVTLKGGSGTNTIDFAGVAGGCPITFNNTEGGGWVLASAYSTSNATNFLNGSLNLAGFNATSGLWAFQNSPSLEFNGATMTLTATGTVWNAATGTPTITNSSGTAVVSLTSASTKTFAGAGFTYPITLNQGGTGALIVTGSNTFNDITNSAIGTVQFAAGATNEFLTGFNLNGALGTPLTLTSTTGVQTILKKSTTWYMGANSTNAGNNTGLTFTAGGGIDYLTVSNINGSTGGTTYSSNIAETATGSDSIVAVQTFEVSLTDTATGTDSIDAAVITAYNVDVAESATGSDSVSATVTYASTVSETATGSDSISAAFLFSSAVSESATGTDSIAATATYARSIAETATGTELVFAAASFRSSVAETATGSDSISALRVLPSTITETATGTDSVSARATFAVSLAETSTGTDSVAATMSYARSISETATGSDSVAAAATFVVSLSESATGADTVTPDLQIFSSVAETATVSDVVSGGLLVDVNVAESSTGADTVAAELLIDRAIIESASGADSVSAILDAYALVAETAAITDATSALTSVLANVSEAATGADTVATSISFPASVTETATGADVVAVVLTLPATVTETAASADTVSVTVTAYPSVSETANGADTVFAGLLYNSAVTETTTGTDAAAAVLLLSVSVEESSTGTDAVAAVLLFGAAIAEAATGSDTVVAGNVIYVSLSELATIADVVASGYLWNIIDDSQTPAWGAVQNDQTPAWASINSDVSATWSSTSTTQSAGWGVVDDSQDPDWQNTNTL